MPSDVIEHVHKLSRKGHQGLEFLNRNGQPFIYPANVDIFDSNNDDNNNLYQLSLLGSLPEDAPDALTLQDYPTTLNSYNVADNVNTDIENAEDVTKPKIDPLDDSNDGEQQLAGVADNEEDADPNKGKQHVDNDGGDPVVDIAAEMEARYGPQASGHNLQPRKLQDYLHMHTIFTKAGSAKPSGPHNYSHP
jgi:hypothetical protein